MWPRATFGEEQEKRFEEEQQKLFEEEQEIDVGDDVAPPGGARSSKLLEGPAQLVLGDTQNTGVNT